VQSSSASASGRVVLDVKTSN